MFTISLGKLSDPAEVVENLISAPVAKHPPVAESNCAGKFVAFNKTGIPDTEAEALVVAAAGIVIGHMLNHPLNAIIIPHF
jgi:hypothetical protein